MIKRHQTTGLLYFCKTSRFDPIKYRGSGLYWKRHLKKYGNHVDTIWKMLFTNKDELIEFATLFSEFYNIVSAKTPQGDKTWGNLEPENGLDGMPVGTDRGVEFKKKSKINNTGSRNPSYGKYWWTNGVEELKSSECPNGWWSGRSPALSTKITSTKKKNGSSVGERNSSYGKKWWTNGTDSIKSKECPEGWYRGLGSLHRSKCSNKLK